MPARSAARRTLLVVSLGAAGAALALATAPTSAATDGSVFSFPRLGTVVVDGTVDTDVNFTVYRILDPNCTGTDFPGPANSCVPQEATDTLVIPAGDYADKRFRLAQVPTCGPTQQDVYEGPYQPTVTVTGTHNYLAGGIMQLGTCASPSPSPSSSSPTSTPSTTSTPSHHTTAPSQDTTTPGTSTTSSLLATGGSETSGATAVGYGPQLASTGTDHTGVLLAIGVGAVLLGGAATAAGRRSARSH